MRVLITGIEGFVGSHTAEFLRSNAGSGVELFGTVFDDNAKVRAQERLPGVRLSVLDITDPAAVGAVFDSIRPDRILHLAGQAFVPASLDNPLGTFQANIFGGITILESARKLKASTDESPAVMIVSSGEVYGRIRPEQLPIDESQPVAPHTPYSASKASLDLIAQQYAAHFGVNVTVVRPFNHVGPGQNPSFVVSDFARQFALIALDRQEPRLHVGNVAVKRDFTDVRDVVRAYWMLFDRKSDDIVFNVASDTPVRISDILDLLRKTSGIEVEIVQEAQRIRKYDVPVVRGSYSRLHEATGWTPHIPLHDTVRDVYAYWLDFLRNESRP